MQVCLPSPPTFELLYPSSSEMITTTATQEAPLHVKLHPTSSPFSSSSMMMGVEPLPVTSATSSAQPRKQKVRFLEARVVGTVAPHDSLPTETRNQIWYQGQELETFKTEARTLCRRIRSGQQPSTDDSNNLSTRGLEQRSCLIRQRNRFLAIRCVLKAQQRKKCPEFLGMISLKCTSWASELATVEAQKDYCEVYQPHLVALFPKAEDILECHPLPIALQQQQQQRQQELHGNKRKASDSNDDGCQVSNCSSARVVRARVA
mmetsp:Transcript_6673/g.10421  ORF Transcript_6673/g.10421 Transcript_6673/m.10421 type:complete len:262 (-) Transcript_6673:523-1308(-)